MPTKLSVKLTLGLCILCFFPSLMGWLLCAGCSRLASSSVWAFWAGAAVLVAAVSAYLGIRLVLESLAGEGSTSAASFSTASPEAVLSKDEFTTKDEIENLKHSLKMLSRQAKDLVDKVERLAVKDKLTGLYNATYIRERLNEEIQRAIHYQRPCAFASIMISGIDEFMVKRGEAKTDSALKDIASVLNNSLSQFDRAARIARSEFIMIFPDKNKKKCIEMIEKIGQHIAKLDLVIDAAKRLELRAGISENPIDGVEADTLFIKAQDRMKEAMAQNKLVEAFI